MFREDKHVLEVNDREHDVIINALNDYRNNKLSDGYTTDIIDDLLIKAIEAPTKKEKRKIDRGEAR